jgi:hypothetical protein
MFISDHMKNVKDNISDERDNFCLSQYLLVSKHLSLTLVRLFRTYQL